MVGNDLLRKQYAKLRTDEIIHTHLASVSKSPGVREALVRLLVYVHSRTDLLSPTPVGGKPAWARAAYFADGLVALARNQSHWLRDVDTWEPSGSSPLRQFGSLARQPYRFANDQARFLFYRQKEPDLHYVPHEDYRCGVTMMSGIPGSGKDAWLAANRPDLPIVSLDDIRAELDVEPVDDQGEVIQRAKERCREFLRSGKSFAFSATNLLYQTRKRWIDLFADYGARIEIVYVEPPLPVILAQNKRRDRKVPETVIRELADKCEPPTWTEAHGLVVTEGR